MFLSDGAAAVIDTLIHCVEGVVPRNADLLVDRPENPARFLLLGSASPAHWGASEGTARNHLDILVGAFVVRALPPWFENLRKRQVKSPEAYLRDSGLLHALPGLPNTRTLSGHPRRGASFEGFAIEQIPAAFDTRDAYFRGTHGGAELDLFIRHHGKRYGFEFEYADAPGSTRSMRVAVRDLGLDHLRVAYPGEEDPRHRRQDFGRAGGGVLRAGRGAAGTGLKRVRGSALFARFGTESCPYR